MEKLQNASLTQKLPGNEALKAWKEYQSIKKRKAKKKRIRISIFTADERFD
ncbi:hypothetical protein [Algoriphagus kandeliae]|uniref:hypothetical protein n=1 Tax=Algoriphagus kandeliae TaxID=2562278 RepID=UPI001F2B0850|nr:hypothetical protein [Algoriphagus kandeliae]